MVEAYINVLDKDDPSFLAKINMYPVASMEDAYKAAVETIRQPNGYRILCVVLRKVSDGSLWIQHKVRQPCYGDLGWYRKNHGEAGYPNHYRPTDLYSPMPDPNLFLPVRLYVKVAQQTNIKKSRAWLQKKSNKWALGLDNPNVLSPSGLGSSVFVTDANVNLTVLVNFLRAAVPVPDWTTVKATYVEKRTWRPVDTPREQPKMYLAEKTWAQGGNYYRGGMLKLWEPGDPDSVLNTES